MQELYNNLVQELNDKYINSCTRPKFNDLFLLITKLISYRSSCMDTRHGALIVKENRIISFGYNGPPSGSINCLELKEKVLEKCGKDENNSCFMAIHAEINAVAYCLKNNMNIKDATIFITKAPCLNCAKTIVATGIKKVIYLESYRISSGKDFLTLHNVEHFLGVLNV